MRGDDHLFIAAREERVVKRPLLRRKMRRLFGTGNAGDNADMPAAFAQGKQTFAGGTVKADRLEPTQAPPKQADWSAKSTFVSTQTQDAMHEKKLHFKQDLDVRGMRGDEALQAVTYFIDDAILVGVPRVRILHGTGTGILRTLIRQYLQTVPGVRHFADEHVQFGGAGITVVDL